MAAYVRNRNGIIHAVNEAALAEVLERPGMAQATLEEWLAQEGLAPVETKTAEPIPAPAAKPGARKTKKEG